jgi:NAD(P)-dependent dehydrogenase (short-subunit alcohol dehydrogenase family)
MLFSGKNIIVTGATGDLGTAITQRLIAQGANILAVASNKAELARLTAEVSGPGALQTFVADVSDSEQVLGYATRAFELWGKVDGFVNNAGIQTPVRPIVEFPEEDFDRVMAVNIRGVFLGMKYVLPRMRDGGSVVNMSSALEVLPRRRSQRRSRRADADGRHRKSADDGQGRPGKSFDDEAHRSHYIRQDQGAAAGHDPQGGR